MDFKISNAARAEIQRWLTHSDFRGHIPTIAWMGDAQGKDWNWSVGTFLRSDLPSSSRGFVTLDGMDFFVEPDQHDNLRGKTLYFENGEFTIK